MKLFSLSEFKQRRFSLTLLVIVIILATSLYFFQIRPAQKYYAAHYVEINGIYLVHPINIENFSLLDGYNKVFTQANLKNHWTFVYFGFTHCKFACPVTLSALNQMYQILQKKISAKDLPQVLFISIDPDHDTNADLVKYVTGFNPHFVSAKTTQEKTLLFPQIFHLPISATNLNEHDTEILLINPQAKIQAYFAFPAQPEKLANAYYSILHI